LDMKLASFEKAMARKPRTDHRTVLVHFGFSQPDQVAKWIKLGGIVSANPYYVTALAGRYAKLRPPGSSNDERARSCAPFRPCDRQDSNL
ncbi:MAG TPA: hypothetical protein VFX50_07320, partial [Gemmatimonadales bacterium]|nr:hypothetical protein [Gemmatimonadales bacterium]